VHKKEAIWVQFPLWPEDLKGIEHRVVTTLMTFDSNQSPAPLIRKGTRREIQVSTLPFTRADSQAFKPADSFITSEAQLSRTANDRQAGVAGFSIKTIVP
jgi:hypothetical protein